MNIFSTSEEKIFVMRGEADPHGRSLVAYRNKGKLSLLYTLGKQNTIPICSKCRSDACPCYKALREEIKKKKSDDGDESDEDECETVEVPWTRESETNRGENIYFEDDLPIGDHYQNYGCNLEKIKYPYDDQMSKNFFDRMQGGTLAKKLPKRLVLN